MVVSCLTTSPGPQHFRWGPLSSLSLSLSLSPSPVSLIPFHFLILLFCIYTYHSSDSDAPFFYILFHLFVDFDSVSSADTSLFSHRLKKQNKSPSKFFSKEIKTKSKCNQQTDVFCLVFYFLFIYFCFFCFDYQQRK